MASNFFNKASLVMVPDAPIDGIQPSVKPEDRSGDFTFTRGSNLSATRVNKSQLIEKGRENVLLQSNQFNTTWISPDATITGGQADRDGGTDAWLLTATNAFHRVVQSISQSGVKRFSVYAKANVNDYLLLGCFEGAHYYATFNLATGAVDSNNINAISPSIENVGNGWYRCSATWVGTTTDVRIASQTTGGQNGWASTTSGSIYIQDAQLEQGLAATSVITTGAGTVQAGLLENTPRLDYSGGATCPSLLLEPSRSNLVTQSEAFSDSYWSKNAAGVVSGFISPEGLSNAYKLVEDTATTTHQIQRSFSFLNQKYSLSAFLKADERNWIKVNLYDGSSSVYAYFDLTNGVVGQELGATGKIENYGNGWYRCSIATTLSVSAGTGNISLRLAENNGGTGYVGDGTSGAYIYGFQAEAGSYATSYIPTYGTSQTRAQDVCGDAGDVNTFNSTEGVLYVEISGFENDLSDRYISISDGTLNNAIRIFYYQDGGTTFFRKNVNSVQTTIVTTNAINKSELTKIAVKYNFTNFDIFSNGVKISTNSDSNSFPISTLNEINFSNADGINNPFYGKTKQLIYFPTALSDDECIALTTI